MMNDKLSAHIQQLHQAAFVIDAHFDLTYDVANRRDRGQTRVIETNYLAPFRAGGLDLVVSAIFIHDFFLPEMGLRKALDQISCLHDEMEESPGHFRLCRTMAEAQAAKADHEVALFLSLEGVDPLQNDIGLLRIFYELGVRGLGLTWSRRNYAADGAFFDSVKEGRKGGLTPFGVKLVEKAEQLGMFIDISHLNDEGFWDVMQLASNPVIASHSNCRHLTGTMRNLSDEQICAIIKNNGVIGMNSVSALAASDKDKPDVSDMVDHIDHIAGLGGINHIGLGLDICHGFENYLTTQGPLAAYDIIRDHGGLGALTGELIRRGYTDDQIIGVLGKNFKRVYKHILED